MGMRIDQRTGALLASTVGAIPLLVFGIVSPASVQPGGLYWLGGIWAYTVLSATIAVVRRPIGDRPFALLSVGGMIGIGISACLMTAPGTGHAILSLIAAIPAMAAMASRMLEVAGFVFAAVLIAVVCSIVMAANAGDALIGTGATVMAVVVPTSIVVGLRRSLERAVAEKARVSETDPLTGTLNRRGLNAHVESLIARAAAGEVGIGFLTADVDHFKRVNDQFGHSRGDEILVETASAIRRACREGTLLARFGGEEFVAMFPAGDPDEVTVVSNRVRLAVERETDVTISVGAVYCPIAVIEAPAVDGAWNATGLTDRLIREADRYLYQAKEGGRNRVRNGASEELRFVVLRARSIPRYRKGGSHSRASLDDVGAVSHLADEQTG
ncbi:hypothetical protein GCM10023147_05510 [Tsukamurella soli]|uniref:GGDEF domain-containing protein n=2 Tax=Tsukamurella soli TaxID=644556 RepID=A0ABP8J4F2_9ACTN